MIMMIMTMMMGVYTVQVQPFAIPCHRGEVDDDHDHDDSDGDHDDQVMIKMMMMIVMMIMICP